MRLVSFRPDHVVRTGVAHGDEVIDLTDPAVSLQPAATRRAGSPPGYLVRMDIVGIGTASNPLVSEPGP